MRSKMKTLLALAVLFYVTGVINGSCFYNDKQYQLNEEWKDNGKKMKCLEISDGRNMVVVTGT